MRKYISLFIILCFVLCSSVVVYAENGENNELVPASGSNAEYIDESYISDSETIIVNEYNIDFPESIGTYALNEDDYNTSNIGTYALNNSVYAGSYNSTILSIWNGLVSNNVGKDYLAYRASQYQYYIFFGEDFEYDGSRFSGTGKYYSLNTQSNGYNFEYGEDSFNVSVSSAYLYTNVTGDYPSLDNERGLIYEQMQTILLLALLSFSVLRWIFINR